MSSTRGSAFAARASLASFHDGLLTRILGCLPFSERLRVATVCKQWSHCAASPELLRSINVRLAQPDDIRAWAGWMQRHTAHVRQLKLVSDTALYYNEEVAGLLATALATCSLATALERLELKWGFELHVDGWVSALTRLQQLKLVANEWVALVLSANLAQLRSLRSLWLESAVIQMLPGTRLPPCLESLRLDGWLDGDTGTMILQQVAQLPRLTSLVFIDSNMDADDYSPLTALKSLRWLDFSGCRHFPACLSQLTWLEALVLDGSFHAAGDDDDDDVAGQVEQHELVVHSVESTLRQLTGLTRLLLSGPLLEAPVLQTVASLSRLQRCCIGTAFDEPEAARAALPEGPWAGSLLSLCASFDTLVSSQPLLLSAQHLEQVCILGPPVLDGSTASREQVDAFWRWAQRHPSLRRLTFDMSHSTDAVPGPAFRSALRLQRERPQVCIESVGRASGVPFCDEFFEVEPL